jgi:hypothetical protein
LMLRGYLSNKQFNQTKKIFSCGLHLNQLISVEGFYGPSLQRFEMK